MERKGLLIRVGADQSFGHANGPIRLWDGSFVYVPIPESGNQVNISLGRKFSDVSPFVRQIVGADHDLTPWLPQSEWMHLDPDFEHLTYGNNENSKGTRLASLEEGDFLAFYASLRAVDGPAQPLIYALIGLIVVDRVVMASDVLEADWHLNAHTRRTPIVGSDVVIFGKQGISGRFEKAIPVGEYRDKAYRVRHDLLDAWGGLTVKDGYIQRSAVPPLFQNPEKFLSWLKAQSPFFRQSNWG